MRARLFFTLCLLLIALGFFKTSFTLTPNQLPADQAFPLTQVYSHDEQTITACFDLPAGYFLYRDRFQFHLLPTDAATLGKPQFPKATLYKMNPDGEKVAAFASKLCIVLPVLYKAAQTEPLELKIQYQGCSAFGTCYPKETKIAHLFINSTTNATISKAPHTIENLSQPSYLVSALHHQQFFLIMTLFFGLGLLLSLTPCVLPMIPILSSIILGQKKITHRHSFGLSLIYVLAMALTYALMGILAGLLGSRIQTALQTPLVITLFALLMLAMALSLFGFFTLELPRFLRNRIGTLSSYQKHGSYLGAAVMGVLSTLILSPCVTPAFASAILYIAQEGRARLGGLALFSMGLGMGIPLLIVGASSAKLLPKTGRWMNDIKILLGFMMLAVAIEIIARIIPSFVTMLLFASLAIVFAVTLRAFNTTPTMRQHLGKALGLVSFVYGILLAIQAMLGGTNPLNPIPFISTSQNLSPFHRITSLAELKEELVLAKKENKPLLLDFFATWCTECRTLDRDTFSDARVKEALKSYRLVRADVTANSPENQALEKYLNVIAPPTILFFSPDGQEIKDQRVMGPIAATPLENLLKK